jgi:hypothetical protein
VHVENNEPVVSFACDESQPLVSSCQQPVIAPGARHIYSGDNLVPDRVDFNLLIPRLDVDENVLRDRVILGVA